jgi:hypothetical protein
LDPASVEIIAGIMEGTGTIIGDVTNDGTLILGKDAADPGTLSETGLYTQNADGTLADGIGASATGVFDVTGSLNLNGTLEINLVGGFDPTNGEIFELASYTGSETGAFAGITGSDAGDWTVLYKPGQVDLEFDARKVSDSSPTSLLLDAGLFVLVLAGVRSKRMLRF